MEQGFLNRSNKASLKKDDTNGSLLSDLAKRVKNIDGKILGRDGKPLLPYRCVKDKVSHSVLVDDVVVGKVNTKDDCKVGCSNFASVGSVNNHGAAGVPSESSNLPTIHMGSKVIGVNIPAAKEGVVDLSLADVIIPQEERIFDHVDMECHKKEKEEIRKPSLDDGFVHGKCKSKGVNQVSKVGLRLPKGKPKLIYNHVSKPTNNQVGTSKLNDSSPPNSKEDVNFAYEKPSVSSNDDSTRPTTKNTASNYIKDDINVGQLRSFLEKRVEEDKGSLLEQFLKSREASKDKHHSLSDSDESEVEEVCISNPIPGDGFLDGLEADLDGYDGYKTPVYDLNEQEQSFCDQYDIRLNSRRRKSFIWVCEIFFVGSSYATNHKTTPFDLLMGLVVYNIGDRSEYLHVYNSDQHRVGFKEGMIKLMVHVDPMVSIYLVTCPAGNHIEEYFSMVYSIISEVLILNLILCGVLMGSSWEYYCI
uniref:Uncharacterized protein n=1 Tax=Tanacetum cinerariifolium TaxID=118510 RepID=A0A6L2M7E2_TANCI|nr:hypothetical protein [Tanacetum cinerariifolium]